MRQATLKLHAKEKVREIVEKYDNVGEIDRVSRASKMLDGVPCRPSRSRRTSPTAPLSL